MLEEANFEIALLTLLFCLSLPESSPLPLMDLLVDFFLFFFVFALSPVPPFPPLPFWFPCAGPSNALLSANETVDRGSHPKQVITCSLWGHM